MSSALLWDGNGDGLVIDGSGNDRGGARRRASSEEILNVRFHIGGEFIGIGPNLQYVGGDEEMSEIERDKLSLQEGEEDSENRSSGSDFEMDEMVNLSDADEPAIVISVEPAAFSDDDVQFVQEVLVPNDSGVITQIISCPVKHIHVDARARRVGAHQVAEE
ncbi:hypothetical protein D1007_44157 [Hordeum vulgare]|nr:hypothetical protein D1007_44157 [Hordeum vulgare]